ncbi:MAG: tol-pal system protein YbgF [Gammaproteobacteria bacterium]|nr:tol-pal system protein YbgF [Gammaproteobacteria bacterium]
MQRLSIVACGLLANIWIAQPAYSQAPVIDISDSGASSSSNNTTGKPASLEGRLSRIERLLENQTLVDLTLRMESMQQEIQRMFGELEVITHDINGLKRRQRELYLDNDRRFQKLESNDAGRSSSSSGTGSGGSPVTGLGSPSVGASAGSSNGTENETSTELSDAQVHKAAYLAAFNLLREGKYDLAKIQFAGFISKYPNSEDANKAQYWLGEVNYVRRNFDVAITEFDKVLANYPDSSKYADALLKIGLSQYELQKWDLATNAFKKIIERYPDTSEARLADKRLQKIKLQKQ